MKKKYNSKKSSKPFIQVSFKPRQIRKLLKYHTIQELKFISFQLCDFGLDAMQDFENKKRKPWIKITNKDII